MYEGQRVLYLRLYFVYAHTYHNFFLMDIGCFIWTRRSRSFYLFNELPNAPLLLDFVEKDFSICQYEGGYICFFQVFLL